MDVLVCLLFLDQSVLFFSFLSSSRATSMLCQKGSAVGDARKLPVRSSTFGLGVMKILLCMRWSSSGMDTSPPSKNPLEFFVFHGRRWRWYQLFLLHIRQHWEAMVWVSRDLPSQFSRVNPPHPFLGQIFCVQLLISAMVAWKNVHWVWCLPDHQLFVWIIPVNLYCNLLLSLKKAC